MTNSETILLVGSDEDVIKDVHTSLSLVNMPLVVARTLQDARRYLERATPRLILCRVHLRTQEKGGLQFARFVAQDHEFRHIPRVLLAKKPELEALSAEMDFFYGHLLLPVVFPVFTQQVQALLQKLTVQSSYEEAPQPVKPPARNQFDPNSDPNYKFKIVQEIQTAVMNSLKASEVFYSARPDEIPDMLAQVTNELCTRYSVVKGQGRG